MREPRAAVWSFKKPTKDRVAPSTRLATYISDTLDLPLHYDARVCAKRLDVLIIVNGAFAFCNALASLAQAVRSARRVIWVQNDYTIHPPGPMSAARSPFRAAFAERYTATARWVDFWTTCARTSAATKRSRYINWNSFVASDKVTCALCPGAADLLYYGAFRQNRLTAFDAYLSRKAARQCPITVSASTIGRSPAAKKFATRYPWVTVIPQFAQGERLFRALNKHGLGLYIEDARSHVEFHSPATRLYEMVSAGLPVVFQVEAREMLAQAKIRVRDEWCVESVKQLGTLMKQRARIQRAQAKEIDVQQARRDLDHELHRAWKIYRAAL